MERIVRRSVMMSIKPSAGEEGIKIAVVFDMSSLTDEQIADWAVSANGVRVWYQNKYRPKGRDYLLELAKKEQVVIVPPCGTRTAADPTIAFVANFSNMSEEAQEAMILELMAKKKGA